MLLYLLNPSKAVIEVADDEEYQRLLKKGFSVPTPEQISVYERQRAILHKKMTTTADDVPDVYFCTVSPGKNGYGVAAAKIMVNFDELNVSYSLSQRGQKIGFLLHQPYSMTRMDNPVKIIYTMFESTKIPQDWIEYLNAADLVLVPSKWCMEVFAASGINTRVVPLGFDDTVFTPVQRDLKKDTHDTFYFLHYDAFNARKGFLEVFKAFVKEFSPDEPVKMIFKTTKSQAGLPILPSQYPNIIVETGEVSDADLAKLCHMADCFVFPSRGEGFGITPLEALGTGMPVIVPNAHGITEYFNEEYMYGVKVTESPALYKRYKDQAVGTMVTADVEDLQKQMRYVYEHEREAKVKGLKAAEYARNWTFKKTAEQLQAIFDEYKDMEVSSKKSNVLTLEEV